MQKLIVSEDREQAIKMGLFDQFKDLFYSNKKADFLARMYDFIHQTGVRDPQSDADFRAIKDVISGAPLSDIEDFFSAKDEVGNSLLCVALKEGHTDTVTAYKKFLELLSDTQRAACQTSLLTAWDINGVPGLLLALQNGKADAIIAYAASIESLSDDQRVALIVGPLTATNINGRSFLFRALKDGNAEIVMACKALLKLLPLPLRSKHLLALLTDKDDINSSGLAWALDKGHAGAITAYKSLLELLPTDLLNTHLDDLLVAQDVHGIPGLSWALFNLRTDAITAYKSLLEWIPEHMIKSPLSDLLLAIEAAHNQGSASVDEARTRRAAHKILLEMVPEALRRNYVAAFAKFQNGGLNLHNALQSGDVGIVTAYTELITLLPLHQRPAFLDGLLASKSKDGSTSLLFAALKKGNANVIMSYKALLEALPEPSRSKCLLSLLTEQDDFESSGLAWALDNGHADAITAYKSLLELLPTDLLTTHLDGLLVAQDRHGIPGLSWALFDLDADADADAIIAYKSLLEWIPEHMIKSPLSDLLLAIKAAENQGSASDGARTQLAAHKILLEMVPVELRGKYIASFAKFQSGGLNLRDALQNGDVGIVIAFTELITLLPWIQRPEFLDNPLAAKGKDGRSLLFEALKSGNTKVIMSYKALLEALPWPRRSEPLLALLTEKDKRGNPGLAWALEKGHAEAITAYKALLELLPESERITHLSDLLAAEDEHHELGLVLALRNGHADAISAYKELLQLIPDGSHEHIFRRIFASTQLSQGVLLDHIGNASNSSLLSCINDIDDRHHALKMRLMVQVAAKIDVAKLSATETESIMDIWARNPEYAQNLVIGDVIIRAANIQKLSADTHQLKVLIQLVQNIVQSEGGDTGNRIGTFMLDNNGFFVQLVALCTNHTEPDIRKAAEMLYDQYLALPEVEQHSKLLRDTFDSHGIRGSIDYTQDHQPLVPLKDDDSAYLFVHRSAGSAAYEGLILSRAQLNGMVSVDLAHEWSNVTLTRQTLQPDGLNTVAAVSLGDFNPAEVYSQFPLFRTPYQIRSQQAAINKLLESLNLKYSNNNGEAGLLTQDYTSVFRLALNHRTSKTKLTDAGNQNTLRKIFGRFLTEPDRQTWSLQSLPTLTDTHIANLLQNYRPLCGGASNANDARILFSLAAVMANLSSSSYLGTEFDSPTAIRFYAAGLLKKAYQVDPSVCSKEDHDLYMSKLLGLAGAFTCTALLSKAMMDHAKTQPDFSRILMAIKPAAWS